MSVETGGIWWSRPLTESHKLGGRGELSLLVTRVAQDVASAFPDKKPSRESPGDKKIEK